jgi:5S rRNA maturation endonuclease (ribonuclease M5)
MGGTPLMDTSKMRKGPGAMRRASHQVGELGEAKITPVLDDLGIIHGDVGWNGEIAFCCVIHNDRNPSASINVEKGAWYCHGCLEHGNLRQLIEAVQPDELDRIWDEYRLSEGTPVEWDATTKGHRMDLSDVDWVPIEPYEAAPSQSDEYDYVHKDGELWFQVVRREDPTTGKTFTQRRPDGKGGWSYNVPAQYRLLYRLPRVVKAIKEGQTIYICEGEKDVHALESVGAIATCNSGGSGKWMDHYTDEFNDADVVIVADRDKAGIRHALRVRDELEGVAKSIRIVGSAVGKDASDHVHNGFGLDDFVEAEWACDVTEIASNLFTSQDDRRRRFLSGEEIAAMTISETKWLSYPIVPDEAAMISFVGNLKAGKTTYLLGLVKALVNGDDFLSHPTTKTPVVYLTEQGWNIFRKQAPEGLLTRDFHGLSYLDNIGIEWPEFVELGVQKCLEVEARVLIIDTVGKFIQLAGDSSNSDGAVRDALQHVSLAQSHGIAVILSKHERKSGGSLETAAAGSYVFGAEADHIVRLTKEKNVGQHQRKLEVGGRFEGALGQFLCEYDPATRSISLLGDFEEEAIKDESVEDQLLALFAIGEVRPLTGDVYDRLPGTSRDAIRQALSRSDHFENVGHGEWRRIS